MHSLIKIAAIALIPQLVGAAPAMASDDAPRAERVSYADLDLTTVRDRRMLDKRLVSAITRVCGSYAEVKAEDADRISVCRKLARASIAPQMAALDNRERVVAVAAAAR